MEYISSEEKQMGMTQEPWGLAMGELDQAEETGHDVTELRRRFAQLSMEQEEELFAIYGDALGLDRREPWPYFEDSDVSAIVATLPESADQDAPSDMNGRVHGAWAGRVIGNMIGKPFEIGPTRESIRTYLSEIGRYPLRGYVPFPDGANRSALGMWGYEGVTEGRIDGAVRDDDIDYTVLGLHVLETYGSEYTTENVAAEWLARFPVYQLFTAERNTYQNLVREVPLEMVGEYQNPFREWIGALIRADIFGFVYAGRPRAAALASFNDAYLSHRGNGIYGEMWAAALIASAFTAATPFASIVESLEHVPSRSRLAEEVREVLSAYQNGADWDTVRDQISNRYPSMNWVHTINNAGALTAAILWGEGDFARTVGLAVMAGLDTDSIGATAGAWAGAYAGYDAISPELLDPLHDTYRSGVFGFGDVRISDLVSRTISLQSTFNN